MKKGTILLAVMSFLLSLAGAAMAVHILSAGDLWGIYWLAEFLLGAVLTAVRLTKKGKAGAAWNFLDLVLFVIGLGLFLLYSRYRWIGLVLVLGFPLRRLLGRETAEERTEKTERFEQHIHR